MTTDEKARAAHGRYYCHRCAHANRVVAAAERYSMGIYAGMLCNPCWDADGRNHDRQHDYLDAGEYFDETDY